MGCQRPQVGSAGYKDPSLDQSPYKQADEFKYLVDIDQGIKNLTEMGKSTSMPESISMSEKDIHRALETVGIHSIKEKTITAEANNSMIHAHGDYAVSTSEESLVGMMSKLGSVEIKLPTHFPKERLAGYMAIAHPGKMADIIIKSIDKSLGSFGAEMGAPQGAQGAGGSSMALQMMLTMAGFDKPEEIYSWMGDEIVIFTLNNPSFDAKAEPSPANSPFFFLTAISSGKPDDGLDVAEKLGDFVFATMSEFGVKRPDGYARSDFKGHHALIIPPPDFANSALAQMMTPDQLNQIKKEKLPSTIVISIPGYLMIGDQPSVEAALSVFQEQAVKTNRTATFEAGANLDLITESFNPTNPGYILDLVGGASPEIKTLMQKFYEATLDIRELGSSRFTLVAPDRTSLEADVTTSRESIRFFEAIQKVINETPQSTWESIGKSIGERMKQQGGMGGALGGPPAGMVPSNPRSSGGDQHEYHFPPSSGKH